MTAKEFLNDCKDSNESLRARLQKVLSDKYPKIMEGLTVKLIADVSFLEGYYNIYFMIADYISPVFDMLDDNNTANKIIDEVLKDIEEQ